MGNQESKAKAIGDSTNYTIVAAIDFGTTFSGWAFSFKHEETKIQTQIWRHDMHSLKTPHCILIDPEGEVYSFGYEAEEKYAELTTKGTHEDWYFFRQFKMMLKNKVIRRNTDLQDACGKTMKAIDVFGMCIKFLKEDLFKKCTNQQPDIKESDIRWVLTVPAIWDDTAKQFMREAAMRGGIDGDNLVIALEPECASTCCQKIKTIIDQGVKEFPAGTKYIVVDAGGGTVDVITHQVQDDGTLKECSRPSGGGFGGSLVNDAFMEFMEKYFGAEQIETLKKQNMDEYFTLVYTFETKKRLFKGIKQSAVTMQIPFSLQRAKLVVRDRLVRNGEIKIEKGKLIIPSTVFAEFFTKSIQGTIDHVRTLLKEKNVSGCTHILLVGGFAECELLQSKLKSAFPNKKVIIPDDAGFAVLKGAVMYGHMTSIISQRMCTYTYGTEATHNYRPLRCSHPVSRREIDDNGDMRCYDIFDIHVRAGESVATGQEQKEEHFYPISDIQTAIVVGIYRSSKKNPHLVTEDGCEKIGTMSIPIESRGRHQEFTASMIFGGTEITVKCLEMSTGNVTMAKVNFLESA